jgi:excisionase family DNA binding protein
MMAKEEPKTITVPEAGKIYFGAGKTTSYEAAKRGQIPTIRIGRRLRVPVAAMERMMLEAGKDQAA